jgi:uncharacterized protein
MSTEENKQVIRDFFTALANGEAERVRELLDDNVAWTIIGDTPVSRTFNGVGDFETGLLGAVFAQIDAEAGVSVDIIELIAEGDKVVARAQGKITGKYGPYNNTYCHVFTVRNGKIVDDIEYLDTLLIERSLYGRKLVE